MLFHNDCLRISQTCAVYVDACTIYGYKNVHTIKKEKKNDVRFFCRCTEQTKEVSHDLSVFFPTQNFTIRHSTVTYDISLYIHATKAYDIHGSQPLRRLFSALPAESFNLKIWCYLISKGCAKLRLGYLF
jgi:hypothetical protein